MKLAEFEHLYEREGDPWDYRSSPYEQVKYERTLEACGPGPFHAALELGGSIGVFSALLAPRCAALTTVDFSAAAVAAARRELRRYPQARAIVGEIPGAIPDGSYDLVVASEILYYLDAPALAGTITRLEEVIAPAGRLVAVHWRPRGPERPIAAAAVHAQLGALPWLRTVADRSTADYLLHVLER